MVLDNSKNATGKKVQWQEILGKNITDVEMCRKCGEAESELIDAISAAVKAHEEAESAAELHGAVAEDHALAVEGFDIANQEYTQAASQFCPIKLESDAEESAFDSVVAA